MGPGAAAVLPWPVSPSPMPEPHAKSKFLVQAVPCPRRLAFTKRAETARRPQLCHPLRKEPGAGRRERS